MDNDYKNLEESAEILKALAHPVRLCIVRGLLEKENCNVTFMKNCLNMPQSTISQHLQKLRAAKIIKGTREGLEVHYKIADDRIENILKALLK